MQKSHARKGVRWRAGKFRSVAQSALALALCLVGLAVLLQFNTFAIALGFGSVGIVLIYPLMKRVTFWPQAVLGLAFSYGALMGWAAYWADLALAPIVLYAGSIAWTIGYDTIYAHQDKEDDVLVGLKSTALRFGSSTPAWLSLFFGITIGALAFAGFSVGEGPWFYAGLAVAAAHLVWQVATLDIDDRAKLPRPFPQQPPFRHHRVPGPAGRHDPGLLGIAGCLRKC